jgi:hypothetical protein
MCMSVHGSGLDRLGQVVGVEVVGVEIGKE